MDKPQLAKNEILVYTQFYSYTAEWLVSQINNFADDAELKMRMHTPGGGVMDAFSVLSRLSDRKGATTIHVDGYAYSMGAYCCLYSNNVIANEQSRFMFHKAAFPSYYDASTDEQEDCKQKNAVLKAKMKARLNDTPEAAALIAKVFESDVRNDVYLSAKEAKKVGLVTEIQPLNLEVKAILEEQTRISAMWAKNQEENATFVANNQINNEKMTIEQIKAEHPAVYSAIMALGEGVGIAKERDRVGSYLAFLEASPEAVKTGIASGVAMTETQRSEFAVSAYKSMINKTESSENPVAVATPAAPTATETATDKAMAEINASLGKTDLTLKA